MLWNKGKVVSDKFKLVNDRIRHDSKWVTGYLTKNYKYGYL